MVGYFAGTKIGAIAYNVSHTYVSVALAGVIGFMLHWPPTLPLCLVWFAHIGFDRGLGYGLKYDTAFRNTHFGRV